MAEAEERMYNFYALEEELHAAIEDDAKYWRENDAKIRAVNQKVPSYEEFRDIVKAAHLKPLDKSDRINPAPKMKGSIWNSLAQKKKQEMAIHEMDCQVQCTQQLLQETDRLPTTTQEFVYHWRNLDISDRLLLLKRMGPSALGHLFRLEIPVGVLGEILHVLLAYSPNTAEIILVVGLLEALTEAKRFSLSLQFLSPVEKNVCKQLMEKLNSSLLNRQQDLAEEGITEWTVLELRKKYRV